MMTTRIMPTMPNEDTELVSASLSGNREAFGRIVSRYQSLICSLAYSATGSLTASEDLAQETFVTAWKQLNGLREPEKLRSWLCGIARNLIHNFLRKQGREPSHRAESLEEVAESQSTELLPAEQAISNEELEILWRSLERIPEIYREPLVMFYREQQSIEAVAVNLELSEDAVKQRLSRGRKLLHEQVVALVEGALARTNPGRAFTIGVLAALPALTIPAKAAMLGATAAKGTAVAKSAGFAGLLSMILSPLVILVGNLIPYRMALAEAQSEQERALIRSMFRKIWAVSLVTSLGLVAVIGLVLRNQYGSRFSGLDFFRAWFVGFVVIYLLAMFSVAMATSPRRRACYSKVLEQNYGGVFPKPAWEYCSRLKFLGLPLVHICIGDRFALLKKPVKAWIAMGQFAFGGLFAFGGVAVAPLSIGGLAIGFIPFGGIVIGMIALGAIAVGAWSFGAIAMGWQSIGGFAIAWDAAVGSFAFARHIAAGEVARALQANNDLARAFVRANWFFHAMNILGRHWFWVNFLWVLPLFVQWRIIVHSSRNHSGNR